MRVLHMLAEGIIAGRVASLEEKDMRATADSLVSLTRKFYLPGFSPGLYRSIARARDNNKRADRD